MYRKFQVARVEDRTLDGVVFDSKREMKRYAELKLREKAGEISDLELQPQYKVFIHGRLLCTCTLDFAYTIKATQRRVIEDVKSSGTAKNPYDRLRRKAVELQYGITIELVGV